MALAGFSRRRGRGAAPGDEPQALRGGDPRLPRAVHRRGDGARRERGRWPSASSSRCAGFSGFGFPKAHAVAFGLLAYQSTWLRVHYGPEFLCSLLNEQPMGFYPPDALVHEAQRRGIEVLPPDVNRSGVECTVERGRPASASRIGLGLHGRAARPSEDEEALVDERERGGPYADLADLASRSGVGRDGLERLAWAGACERDRRRRTSCGAARGAVAARRRRGGAAPRPPATPRQLSLPLSHPGRAVAARAGFVGAAGRRLRVDRDRARRAPDGAAAAGARRTGWPRARTWSGSRTAAACEVAGMVVARQRPGDGQGVVFMLLEDEVGDDQRRRPAARLPAASPGGAGRRRSRAVERQAGAPRGGHQRGRVGRRARSPRRTSPAPRSGTSSRPRSARPGATDGTPARRRIRRAAELAAVAPAAHSFGRRGR